MFKEQQKLKENILSIFDKYEDVVGKYNIDVKDIVGYDIRIIAEKGYFMILKCERKREDVHKINEELRLLDYHHYFCLQKDERTTEKYLYYDLTYEVRKQEKNYIEEYLEIEKIIKEKEEEYENKRIAFNIQIFDKNNVNIFYKFLELDKEKYNFIIEKLKEIYSTEKIEVIEEKHHNRILIKL